MPQIPPAGHQRIVPYLAYRDAPAAIEFLCEAFGFEEVFRLEMDEGKIGHAELTLGDAVLCLASCWDEAGFASPGEMSSRHSQVQVYVEDVDAHHARAREAGATITAEPKDQFYGAKTYRAADPEGHWWIFSQPTEEHTPEELQAKLSG